MAQKGKRLARYESQASQKCITLSVRKKMHPAISELPWIICYPPSTMAESKNASGDKQIEEYITTSVVTNTFNEMRPC